MTGKISEMPAAAALDGTEEVPIVQGGANARATAQAIANLASSSGASAVSALAISAGAVNIDLSLGQDFTLALTANVTSMTFSNMPAAGKVAQFELQITQDATGGRTLALPSSFHALGGSDTAIASGANAVTVLSAKSFDNGATWRYAMQESA